MIADEDTDMTNNAHLEGALIRLVNLTMGAAASDTTGSDGMYKIDNLAAGNYEITITKTGYITILEAVSIADNVENYYNAAVEAISQNYAGNGTASGTVYDVLTGQSVPSLALNIREGINMTNGYVKATFFTDADGKYTTPTLPAGNYSVEIRDDRNLTGDADRYLTSTITAAYTFYVPSGDGTLWTVFSYDSGTGIVSPVNTMSYQSSAGSVGSNYQVRDAVGFSIDMENDLLFDEAPLKDYEIAELQNSEKTDGAPEDENIVDSNVQWQ